MVCRNYAGPFIIKSGNYQVTGIAEGLPETVNFTLILNPVGIQEIPKADNFIKVFPNPAHNFVKVQSEQETFKK